MAETRTLDKGDLLFLVAMAKAGVEQMRDFEEKGHRAAAARLDRIKRQTGLQAAPKFVVDTAPRLSRAAQNAADQGETWGAYDG